MTITEEVKNIYGRDIITTVQTGHKNLYKLYDLSRYKHLGHYGRSPAENLKKCHGRTETVYVGIQSKRGKASKVSDFTPGTPKHDTR